MRSAGRGLAGAGLVVLLLGEFMVQLDTTIVNVALPSVQRDLGFARESDLAWVVNAYVLLYGGFLLLAGRAGDLYGRRRVLLGGIVLFSVASAACAVAPSAQWLVIARGAQGLGAAAVAPSVLSMITSSIPEGPARARALGAWGAVAGAGAVLGLLLGGLLTDLLTWRWVFWINVPVGLVLLVLAPRLLPEGRSPGRPRLDLPGAVLVTGALLVLVFTLVQTVEVGWGSARTVAGLVVAVGLMMAFVVRERTAAQPLVRLGLLARRTIGGTAIATLLFGTTQFGLFFFLALYVQQVLDFSPLAAGVAFLPFALGYGASTGIASSIAAARGPRVTLVPGLALVAVAQLWLTLLDVDSSYLAGVLGPLLVAGAGLGLAYVPLSIAASSGVAPEETGLASGLFNSSLQIGGAVGLAVLSTLATNTTLNAAAAGADRTSALVEGFHRAFAVGAGLAVAALLISLVVLRPTTSNDSTDSTEGAGRTDRAARAQP